MIETAMTIIILFVLAGAVMVFWQFYFLRKPVRKIPIKGIVSPANGKIVKIIKFGEGKEEHQVPKGMLGKVKVLTSDIAKKGYLIVIMMTPFDVHYQRSPINGKVVSVKHQKGRFLNAVAGASDMKASLENEKNTIIIKGKIKVKIIQVAGFLARRIQSFVIPKQNLYKGEILGRINLGSQVILVIPKRKLLVFEGDEVIEGTTVISE